jgi:putative ABC transport system permease protein
MQFLKELWRRICWLARQSRFHSELASEMQFHMESRVEELEQKGMPRTEALALARREFGSRMKVAEDTAGAWQLRWMEDLYSDLVYAGRALRRNPGFALTAIFCLALGIGANTTIFSITTSFLFGQPSCRDAASLISIWPWGSSAGSLGDYKFIRSAQIFESMAGIDIEREVNLRDGDRNSRFYAGVVTDDFFTTLGIPFLLGRGIAPRETDTAVLSERVWRSVFGGDPAILGKKVILDGRVYAVAGVLPANHRSVVGFSLSPDVYIPLTHDDESVQFYARLRQGMTVPVAQARLQGLSEQLDRNHPMDGWKRTRQRVRVTGVTGFDALSQEMPGAVTAFFAMLMIVVGLVLLIAFTNVASLLLARSSSRSHELAIRLSLGASRRRIIRHLLAESLLLSILGLCAGLLIDIACTRWIGKITLPVPAPLHFVILPDWRLLGYSVGVVMASALLCRLLPALKASKRDVNQALKLEVHQTNANWNLRSLLVAGQLAVSIVLLAAAFLFVHNLLRATSMDPGFNIENTVWAQMRLVPDNYSGPDQIRQMALARLALERLRALPGVASAAISQRVPLNGNCVIGAHVRTDVSATAVPVEYQCNNVGPEYFRTMGIPILRGREFAAQDRKGAPAAVIVSENFARTVFGDVDPLGHSITLDLPNEKSKLIVGVAKDSKYFTLSEKQRLAVYEPYFAFGEPTSLQFWTRTAGSPAAFIRPITDALAGLDSTAAVETKPMSRSLGFALLPSRVGAAMLGTMGMLGLLLAAIGLYGVLLYSVSGRTREIGLRMALGATRFDVLRLIGKQCLILLGGGGFAGLLISAFAMQPLALFLVPGVKALDWTVLLAVMGVMAAVASPAILVPAVRALQVDPMTALRYE